MPDYETEHHDMHHNYTDEAVCPYCLEEQSDSWEFNDWVERHECDSCDKTFSINRNITVNYSTTKLHGE